MTLRVGIREIAQHVPAVVENGIAKAGLEF